MSIHTNLKRVQACIKEASERSGRSELDVRLLGVTKYATDQQVQELLEAGLTSLAENRVQNARERTKQFPQVQWDFIGRLQTNKVRYCERFYLIHSLDRWSLAQELNKRAQMWGKTQNVLIQVNVSGEKSKTGLDGDEVESFAKRVLHECPNLKIKGLMTMAPLLEAENTRPYFRETKQLYEQLQKKLGVKWDTLSMGMTNDFEVAIEEGATLVRIGSALFSKEDST